MNIQKKPNNKAVVIAEMGTSHNGDIKRAEDLISAAAEAGADCIKTQIIFANEIIHPETGKVILPGGPVKLYDRFKKLEKDFYFYEQLKDIANKKNIEFLASPFGIKSLEWLIALKCNTIKIASPELNHFQLIKKAGETGKNILFSTGVSMLYDIKKALETAEKAGCPKNKIGLLHCITSYPAPEDQYNIRLLTLYKNIFGVKIGVSDHSLDPLIVPATSVLSGASIIEKHITLTKTDGGLDDPIALVPAEFKKMVLMIRKTEAVQPEKRRAFLDNLFGKDRINDVLGNGEKKLATSEKANYGRTNRSIHALSHLAAGTVLSNTNIAVLRTEKMLKPGIRPEYYEIILGKKLVNDVAPGQGIRSADIGIKNKSMDFPL